jgi:hypothetical protein
MLDGTAFDSIENVNQLPSQRSSSVGPGSKAPDQ